MCTVRVTGQSALDTATQQTADPGRSRARPAAVDGVNVWRHIEKDGGYRAGCTRMSVSVC
ncbi:MAG: hypothetical protein AB7V13_31095 [Pseudorhodoplanes sp.]